MRQNLLWSMAFAGALAMSGCSDDKQTTTAVPPQIVVEAGVSPIDVAADQTECSISFKLDGARKGDAVAATSKSDWITVRSVDAGTVLLGLGPNPEHETREGNVELDAPGAQTVAVTIRQAALRSEIRLREDSRVIEADPQGNDERDEEDVLTAYYEIVNPVAAGRVTAVSGADWIVITEAYSAFIDFRVRSNETDQFREGTLLISYPGAEDAVVRVTQGVMNDPVIVVSGEQPLRIGRKGQEIVYANFKIENRRGDETVTATPDVEWITMKNVSSGYMGFSVGSNKSNERKGRIRLTYRNADPVDFVVIQTGVPEDWGEGLEVKASEITAASVHVNVRTFIDETYSVGVVPKSDIDRYGSDKAFLDQLVYEMRQEFASLPGDYFTFAEYFALTDDDSFVDFGVGPDAQRLQSDTDYYAFAFDLTADADNNITYSGVLYKTEFRTLPAEQQPDMTFSFRFEGEGTKAKLVCTPSDLTRPYCLCVLPQSYVGSKTPEELIAQYLSTACEFFTGEAQSTSYLSKYTSPYVAMACGFDQQNREITSSVTVFDFEFPPVAAAFREVLLHRAK